MAKVYAVRVGLVPGIYKTWDEAKVNVLGFPGAKYKSFSAPTIDEANCLAEAFMEGKEIKLSDNKVSGSVKNELTPYELAVVGLTKDDAVAYTDGSYNEEDETGGAAFVYVVPEKTKPYVYAKKVNPDGMRQVKGEIVAVELAINKAIESNKKTIEIRYDYIGVEKWVTGEWQAKNACTRRYKKRMEELSRKIEIRFNKVDAHSGNEFNDLADFEAKKVCGKA